MEVGGNIFKVVLFLSSCLSEIWRHFPILASFFKCCDVFFVHCIHIVLHGKQVGEAYVVYDFLFFRSYGADNESDGLCDAGDPDDDNDTVLDGDDSDAFDQYICQDIDSDTCDDCSQLGSPDVTNDGADNESDGLCDIGDPDDDNFYICMCICLHTCF